MTRSRKTVAGVGDKVRTAALATACAPLLGSTAYVGTIANNSGKAIVVGAPSNRIRRNAIYGHAPGAIAIDPAANAPGPPVITSVAASTVAGISCARCTIEIFSGADNDARWYEGSTVADANGDFSFTKGVILRGPKVTVTATDANGSTSALAASVATRPVPPRRRSVHH